MFWSIGFLSKWLDFVDANFPNTSKYTLVYQHYLIYMIRLMNLALKQCTQLLIPRNSLWNGVYMISCVSLSTHV